MRILLVNPPRPAIGSRIPDDHLPPLGLLSIGGPLIDAGHDVKLLDADRLDLPLGEIRRRALEWKPDVILVGSTRADDIVRDADLLHLYKKAGVQRWLLGMENTDEETLKLIKKNGTVQKDREVIQKDQSKWDYKHQVLKTKALEPWQVLLWSKLTEVVLQARPTALKRLFFRDPGLRHAQRWYTQMGRRVWPHELLGWLFRDERTDDGTTLEKYWGASLSHEEESMVVEKRRPKMAMAG